jgi:hypothetical protein
MIRCRSCGGRYQSPQGEFLYWHVCPPLSEREVEQQRGRPVSVTERFSMAFLRQNARDDNPGPSHREGEGVEIIEDRQDVTIVEL